MQFVLICEDKPDSLELRLANRDKHLEFEQDCEGGHTQANQPETGAPQKET